MPDSIRFSTVAVVLLCLFVSAPDLSAQNQNVDTRREYVRSSSPTKSGGRVISESIGGQKMVRIARAPGSTTPDRTSVNRLPDANRNLTSDGKYDYPDGNEGQEITAFRQAANQAPQLQFPPQNRLAQCNCNGVPVPPQQLQFPQSSGFAGFQNPSLQAPQPFFPQQGFAPQQGFGGQGQGGFPFQSGIGVPQFNQTGGSWWTPFITGSGYYTPLLNFRNLPQGSYLGQGIIGQPTAYVDGQPVRNLLRYISP